MPMDGTLLGLGEYTLITDSGGAYHTLRTTLHKCMRMGVVTSAL